MGSEEVHRAVGGPPRGAFGGRALLCQQRFVALTRENVMKQAANLQKLDVGTLLPGITINTSPTDFAPMTGMSFGRVPSIH